MVVRNKKQKMQEEEKRSRRAAAREGSQKNFAASARKIRLSPVYCVPHSTSRNPIHHQRSLIGHRMSSSPEGGTTRESKEIDDDEKRKDDEDILDMYHTYLAQE